MLKVLERILNGLAFGLLFWAAIDDTGSQGYLIFGAIFALGASFFVHMARR